MVRNTRERDRKHHTGKNLKEMVNKVKDGKGNSRKTEDQNVGEKLLQIRETENITQ